MADEESSRDSSEDHSDRDHYKEKIMQAANSSLDKLQFLAEDSLEYFNDQKNPAKPSPQKTKSVLDLPPYKNISFDEIKQRLINLIAQEEEDEETGIIYWRPGVLMDEMQKISFVSHTMTAFVATLDDILVRRLALLIFQETSVWINRIFRYFDSSAYFHRNNREGLVQIVKLLIHSRYPKYLNTGYESLYTRPPVIYFCEDCFSDLQQLLCFELGLPNSCVVPVPTCSSSNDENFSIDISVLEQMVAEHKSTGKIPLMVVGCVGSSLVGNIEDMEALQSFCNTHSLWLHVDGYALAGLCLISPNSPPFVAHSMTLCLGKWIGIPTLPYITLYKCPDEATSIRSLGSDPVSDMLFDVMPVWVTIQALGHSNIISRIHQCFQLTDYLMSKISCPRIRFYSKQSQAPSPFPSGYDVESTGLEAIFNASTSVIFQYIHQSSETDEIPQKNPAYFDNLNSWLVSLLARNIPSVKTEIHNSGTSGVCLRICFLESANVMHTEMKSINSYSECLLHQLGILNATVKQRDLLYKKYSDLRKLKLVQISEWAGMGGARYIPEIWADRLNELTDTGKEDINSLNSDLVAKLKISDSAFSVGEADDGMLCVRFGMVDEELNMDELISLVLSTGQEIEDSSRYLETMSEMVKNGIEEAKRELILENQEKIMQEGILKQVPVINSLVSWWFPTQTESGVKGRSFNLASGTIESTENIYKYHMQVKEGGPNTPPPASKVLIKPTSCSNTSPSASSVEGIES